MGCDLGGGYSGGCSLWVLILPTGEGTPSPGAWAGKVVLSEGNSAFGGSVIKNTHVWGTWSSL